MPKIVIGVMGPGDRATAAEQQTAYALGQRIAQAGWVLLTGGRNVGVMDASSRGAQSAGGLTIGILPTADFNAMSAAIDIPILTDLGNARNNINILSSQVIVACGLGAGTASEVALALKSRRPVILLHCDALAQQFFQQLGPDCVAVASDLDEAMHLIETALAHHMTHQPSF